MAPKTVALDKEAYALLRGLKRAGESLSDVVKRLARPRRPLSSFGGMWSDMTEKERKTLDRTYANLREADRRRAEKIRKTIKLRRSAVIPTLHGRRGSLSNRIDGN